MSNNPRGNKLLVGRRDIVLLTVGRGKIVGEQGGDNEGATRGSQSGSRRNKEKKSAKGSGKGRYSNEYKSPGIQRLDQLRENRGGTPILLGEAKGRQRYLMLLGLKKMNLGKKTKRGEYDKKGKGTVGTSGGLEPYRERGFFCFHIHVTT